MDKVAVFVDLGYLNRITGKLDNLKINFEKLKTYFMDLSKEEFYRMYIYYCPKIYKY